MDSLTFILVGRKPRDKGSRGRQPLTSSTACLGCSVRLLWLLLFNLALLTGACTGSNLPSTESSTVMFSEYADQEWHDNTTNFSEDFNHIDFQPLTTCFNVCKCHLTGISSSLTSHLTIDCGDNTPQLLYSDPVMEDCRNISEVTLVQTPQVSSFIEFLCDYMDLEAIHLRQLVEARFKTMPLTCFRSLTMLEVSQSGITTEFYELLVSLSNLKQVLLNNNNISSLPRTESQLDFSQLEKLDISSNQLRVLDLNSLGNLSSLTNLNASWNRLNQISNDFLSSLSNLHVLDLSRNSLRDLEQAFSSTLLSNLLYLNLSYNGIVGLQSGVLSGLHSLKDLDLSHNAIEMVPQAVFNSTDGLTTLQLAFNRLVSIERGALADLSNLRLLNLSHNYLAEVNGDMFHPVSLPHILPLSIMPDNITKEWPPVDVMDLSFNNISRLTRLAFETTFSTVHQLLLSHNKIHNLPRYGIETLKDLEVIDLSHNDIGWLDVGTFKNSKLRKIDLSHNKLVKIISMTFLYLPQIQYVDLSHNRLSYIYKYTFYKTCGSGAENHLVIKLQQNSLQSDAMWKLLSTFRHLEGSACSVFFDLRNNRITHLLGEALDNIQRHIEAWDFSYFRIWNYVTVNIKRNPITCDCAMYLEASAMRDLVRTFEANFTGVYRIRSFWEGLTCAAPPLLRNVRLNKAQNRIQCNITDYCPEHCRCKYSPSNQIYTVDCSSRGLTSFPRTMPLGVKSVLLQHNEMRHLPSNITTYDIMSLDLSHNKLSYIADGAWAKLLDIPVVSLDQNQIENLPRRVLESKDVITRNLSLIGLQLTCDCETLWIKQWLLNHSLSIHGILHIDCVNYPVKGRRIIRVDDSDFVCLSALQMFFGRYVFESLKFAMPALLVLASVIFIIVCVVKSYRRCLRGEIIKYRHPEEDVSEIKDLLIAVSPQDVKWVRKELIPHLTSCSPPYTVLLRPTNIHSDALLGDFYLDGAENVNTLIFIFSYNTLLTYSTNEDLRTSLMNIFHSGQRVLLIYLEDIDLSLIHPDLECCLKQMQSLVANDMLLLEKLFYILPAPGIIMEDDSMDQMSPHYKKY